MAVIRVQNYTPAPPTLRDGAIVTTKQDTEEHGYGIKSIKSIAELYGGTADCFVEDSIFYLVVTFPCGKSQKETAYPKSDCLSAVALLLCHLCRVF